MLGSSEHLILQSVGSSLYQWILIQKVALYISAHLAFVCWQAIIYYYYWTHYLFGNLFLITGTPLIQKYRQACTSGPIVACLPATWSAELISGFSARRLVNIVAGNRVQFSATRWWFDGWWSHFSNHWSLSSWDVSGNPSSLEQNILVPWEGYRPVAAPHLPVSESAQQRRMCFLGGDWCRPAPMVARVVVRTHSSGNGRACKRTARVLVTTVK